jgi:hypothetical protein
VTDDGHVHVGIDRPDYYNQCWFTDGYFDFVPHFLEGMAALPAMAPDSTDHLLRSSSIVTSVTYQPRLVAYRTFDASAAELLKLTFTPTRVLSGGTPIEQADGAGSGGWQWDPDSKCLHVRHPDHEVRIEG